MTKITAEKPVSHSNTIEIKYDFERKEVDPSKMEGIRTATVINRSYFPQCTTRSYEFSVGESSSFVVSQGLELGATLGVSMPGAMMKGISGSMTVGNG